MKRMLVRLCIQFACAFALSFISYLLRPVSALYWFLIYLFIPVFSAYSAIKIVINGINPYLAWILPGISEALAGFLISLGIAPDPLPIMITFLISLIGAAIGDVINKTNKKGRI